METKQHTPGPWIVRPFPTASYGRRQLWVMDSIPDQDGKVIANAICLVSASNPNEEANAILLGAADDLLEACKALREAALNLRGEYVCEKQITAKTLGPMFAADDMAQAAIAKATKVN